MIELSFRNIEKGESIVELLVAIGLAALLLPALLTGIAASRGGRAQENQRLEAISSLKNAQEAVRSVAQNNWTGIATNGTFHPIISGNSWALASGAQVSNGFTISTVISDTQRNSSGVIVSSGGTVDPSTKKVIITVSWLTPIISNVSSTSYYTRHKNNLHTETTQVEFNKGATSSATTGVAITNSSGGEVTLGSGGGGGDWCQPSLTLSTVDLPKSGVANAITAIEGKVFAGTGDNAAGVSFADINVTTTHPPAASLQKTFDGYKTNGVFGEQNYAYLATDTNSKEVVIINLNQYSDPPTNSKYKEEGFFNAPGNGSANSIYVYGNYGYMTSGTKFYIFDLTSKSGSRSQVNSVVPTLAGTGLKIQIVGNYAYVATTSTSNQLQIINISNPASPSIVGSLQVAGLGGKDIFINAAGTRAYLATANSGTQNEMFIINISNPASPVLISGGVFNSNGMDPKGIVAVTGNRVIIVGTGGTSQYQVINVNNENSPVSCGNLQVATGINGIASVLQSNGYAYSYIITGDSASELKIILGGAGAGSNFNSTGVFESYTFDSGYEVAWNNISATVSVPSQTTLQYKVAIKDPISNSCSGVSFSNADFVGLNGQTTDFFPYTGGVMPFDNNGSGYENPGRCMKYRVYMTSNDISQTPVIYDFSVNYSP